MQRRLLPMVLETQRSTSMPVPRKPQGSRRDALDWKRPQRRPQRRLGRRLEEVAKAVGGGYCRLQTPWELERAVRAGHPGGGGGGLAQGRGGGRSEKSQGPKSALLHELSEGDTNSRKRSEEGPVCFASSPASGPNKTHTMVRNAAVLAHARAAHRDPPHAHRSARAGWTRRTA